MWTFAGNIFFVPVSSRFWSLAFRNRLYCCHLLLFVSVCALKRYDLRIWEYESMGAWEYEGRTLWYYDPMVLWDFAATMLWFYETWYFDSLRLWDYEWKRYYIWPCFAFCLYLINTCIFYRPASFRHVFVKNQSLRFFNLICCLKTVFAYLSRFFVFLSSKHFWSLYTYFFSRVCRETTGPEDTGTENQEQRSLNFFSRRWFFSREREFFPGNVLLLFFQYHPPICSV